MTDSGGYPSLLELNMTESYADKPESYADNSIPVVDEQTQRILRVYQFIVPITFSLIVVLGLVGNTLVIHVILSRRKLQTVTNLLLLNLAVSDVSFLLICGGFYVVHYVLLAWPLGDVLCRLIQYLLYVTCYVTVYTLIAVSLVRFLIVVYRTRAKPILSQRNIVILIVLMWIVFMVAKIPILIVHGEYNNEQTGGTECIIVGKIDGRRLFASFFVFAYALPLLLICTLYLLILRHIKRARGSAAMTSQNGDVTSCVRGRKRRHVTRCVVVVVLTFALCWLPLHVHLLVEHYGQVPQTLTYKILLIFWHGLSFANSTLNPLIYNCFSKDFRDGFREVMSCARRQENPADMSLVSHL